ncbi:MAG: hypothetical protein EBY21_14050 [Alphaproteobacteria bacterium]|nr:hypothetical protein [Alphaproteobacteria bacterium]
MTMMQDSNFVSSTSHKVKTARDARAEGGKRRILMSPSGVTIERHIHGIAMRVGIPATAYLGVALSLTGEADQDPTYKVRLAHADHELDIELSVSDSPSALEEWSYWSAYFSRPQLVESHDGSLQPVLSAKDAQDSPSLVYARRHGSSVKHRRPRFLMRRRNGKALTECNTFSGETEIICYE